MEPEHSSDDYRREFKVGDGSRKQREALRHALDIRKFEISLYWTRATYFWTFIGAALGAYGVIQTIDKESAKADLSVFVSCIGFTFSFAWWCVNKGSKKWQENWENHVDLLEEEVIGPLYKRVLTRPPAETPREHFKNFMVGPDSFSVTKINQLICFYIGLIWVFLLFHALPPFSWHQRINREYVSIVCISAIACLLIWRMGRSHSLKYRYVINKREVVVANAEERTPAGNDDSRRVTPLVVVWTILGVALGSTPAWLHLGLWSWIIRAVVTVALIYFVHRVGIWRAVRFTWFGGLVGSTVALLEYCNDVGYTQNGGSLELRVVIVGSLTIVSFIFGVIVSTRSNATKLPHLRGTVQWTVILPLLLVSIYSVYQFIFSGFHDAQEQTSSVTRIILIVVITLYCPAWVGFQTTTWWNKGSATPALPAGTTADTLGDRT